jgi:hypothetical protein
VNVTTPDNSVRGSSASTASIFPRNRFGFLSPRPFELPIMILLSLQMVKARIFSQESIARHCSYRPVKMHLALAFVAWSVALIR